MTHGKEAQAQARAERFADLVKDTEIRREILALATELRRSAWNAAATTSPEPRSYRPKEGGAGS